MNREDMKKVFKVIASVYPQFEVSTEKLDLWTRVMREHDPVGVLINAERYVLSNKFPPTIADIKAPPKSEAHSKSYLDKIKRWEAEASGGPKHKG